MAYNPRMSMARPTPNGKTRVRQQEEDSFMTLSEREIAGCINDIGISFGVADLQKPNPQQIQRVFEWFAELLMNSTREVVAPAMKAAADDLCGPYAEIFPADSRDLVGFFVTLRRLLQETAVMDEHFNKSEKTKQRIEQLHAENRKQEGTLADLERNQKSTDALLREKEARSNSLKNRLYELKAEQERVSERLERVRQDQQALKASLEEKAAQVVAMRLETAKLMPYTTQSPAALEATLVELNKSLVGDKAQIESFERRARALQASSDAFRAVTGDVDSCTSLLSDLAKDLAAEEATLAAAAKNRDALSERSNNVRDVERRERQLQKQLETLHGKTARLRTKADERRDVEGAKMAELKRMNDELRRERTESSREMERRRIRIEQTEKKMADLRDNLEAEIKSAHDEYLKMDAHVRLYVREMEQSIG